MGRGGAAPHDLGLWGGGVHGTFCTGRAFLHRVRAKWGRVGRARPRRAFWTAPRDLDGVPSKCSGAVQIVRRGLTVRVSFTLPSPSEVASVYHSDDGVNWQTLGSGSSARTHKFSYFFAGEIDTSVVSAHTVQVQNRSQNFGTVYIYRESPDPGVFSVAMMSMQLAPEQRWISRWSETYDFFTSMTELIPGVQLTPWQTVGASLTGNNLVTLTTTGFFPSGRRTR